MQELTPRNYAWWAAFLSTLGGMFGMFWCTDALILLINRIEYFTAFNSCRIATGILCAAALVLSEKDKRWQTRSSLALTVAWMVWQFDLFGLRDAFYWFMSGQWVPPGSVPILGAIILFVFIWQIVNRPRDSVRDDSWMPRHKIDKAVRDFIFRYPIFGGSPQEARTGTRPNSSVFTFELSSLGDRGKRLLLFPSILIIAVGFYYLRTEQLPVEAIALCFIVAIVLSLSILRSSGKMESAQEELFRVRTILGFEYFDGTQDALTRDLSRLKLFDTWPWDNSEWKLSIKGKVNDQETILMYAWRENYGLFGLFFSRSAYRDTMMCIASCFRVANPTLPSFYLQPRVHWWSGMNPEKGIRTDVDVSLSYMVEPSDSRDVRRLFQPPVMRFLELHKGWYVYNEGSWFIAYKRWGKGFDAGQICRLASDAQKLLRLFQESQKA